MYCLNRGYWLLLSCRWSPIHTCKIIKKKTCPKQSISSQRTSCFIWCTDLYLTLYNHIIASDYNHNQKLSPAALYLSTFPYIFYVYFLIFSYTAEYNKNMNEFISNSFVVHIKLLLLSFLRIWHHIHTQRLYNKTHCSSLGTFYVQYLCKVYERNGSKDIFHGT